VGQGDFGKWGKEFLLMGQGHFTIRYPLLLRSLIELK